MIDAIYYQDIYLFVVTILTFFVMANYRSKKVYLKNRTGLAMTYGTMVLALLMIFFIGTRPNSYVFADHMNYYNYYMRELGKPFHFTLITENVLFDNFWMLLSSHMVDIVWFYLSCALVYFGCMFIACKKLFPSDTMLAFLVCLAAFQTFAAGTNGFKNGAAASVFLVAIAYKDKKFFSILMALASYGIHHSMQVLVAAYIATFFIKSVKWYFYLWGLCVILSAMHFTVVQEYFATLTDEQGAGYLRADGGDDFITGFRPDFILYSSMPVIVGWYMIFKQNVQSSSYDFILKLYLLTNALWMLCMYASFTNRIAYLSWFMYPIVLLYPFLATHFRQKAHKFMPYIVYGHLGFTLFMHIIYY